MFLWVLMPAAIKEWTVNKMLPYDFEMFYNLSNQKGLSTTSTDRLTEMLQVLDGSNKYDIFVGTGYYQSKDGTYCGNTDSGYLRHILFDGIFYMFLFYFYQLRFFLPSQLMLFSSNNKRKNYILFNVLILICLLVMHIKSEVLGFAKYPLIAVFFYNIGNVL